MGRRRVRVYGTESYALAPEEMLLPEELLKAATRKPTWCGEDLFRPRFGPGSGRAGGARSAVHATDHRRFLDVSEIRPERCVICLFGLKLWHLWTNSQYGFRGEWDAYWEYGSVICQVEKEQFERLAADCGFPRWRPECDDRNIPLEYRSSHSGDSGVEL